MFGRVNLAPLRYRRACASAGPVARIEWGTVRLWGEIVQQANVWLRDGLRPRQRVGLYSDADGTGTARTAAIARYKAISEALERWAYDAANARDDRSRYGFDLDPTSAGMAAFPGFVASTARATARNEAIERACLIAWSDGQAESRRRAARWPGVEAVEIASPVGGVCVILFRRHPHGFYAYGHAAAASFSVAAEQALVELGRNELVLTRMHEGAAAPANLFERRCAYFATPAGFASFDRRIGAGRAGRWRSRLLIDTEVPGLWSQYATVWRVVFEPATDRYLSPDLDVFVW